MSEDGSRQEREGSDGYAEALRRIDAARAARAAELDLTYLNLTTVPMEIRALREHLQTLDLAGNQLESNADLAAALGGLHALQELDLGSNQLTSNADLAAALGGLHALQMLYLFNNQLTSNAHLAKALGGLHALQRLYLRYNRLQSNADLAVALGGLHTLQTLGLSWNQLESNADLAASLGGLHALQELDLGSNQLTSNADLAAALGGLHELNWLDLSNNQLASNAHLAAALGGLHALQTLYLGTNQLESNADLAAALGGLYALQELNLGNNQLASNADLAAALGGLHALQTLYLFNNQLESNAHLAAALGGLHELQELNLGANQLESNADLATALGGLHALHEVDLTENKINLSPEVLESRDAARIIRELRSIAEGRSSTHPEFKVVILGEGRIGKTQLRRRLMNEKAVKGDTETESFEWVRLTDPVRKEDAAKPATLHLFDFGGQHALLASHRFFLSHRRTIFVICAPVTWTLDESRVSYWLQFVSDLADQAAREDAASTLSDDRDKGGRARFEDLLEEARARHPVPPVIVVLTHARTRHARRLDVERVRALCKERRATLIEDFDCLDGTEQELAESAMKVRRAIDAAALRPELAHVWTEQYSNSGIARREQIKTLMGFDDTGFNLAPMVRTLTVDEYLRHHCDIADPATTPEKDPARLQAMDDLATMRDLGFVHWLGGRKDLERSFDKIKPIIFSPAWVRGPVYRVLRAEDPSDRPLSERRVEALMEAGANPPTGNEISDILNLMLACGLMFEVRDAHGVRQFLVPDRLSPGNDPPLIASDRDFTTGERGFRLRLDFAPDHLMPRLIGELYGRAGYECGSLTRRSLWLKVSGWIRDEMVAVKICLDQTAAVLRVGIVCEEAKVIQKALGELESIVKQILKPRQIGVFEECFGGKAERAKKSEDEINALRDERKALVEALLRIQRDAEGGPTAGISENDATLLKEWFNLCDKHVTTRKPWVVCVLAGISRALYLRNSSLAGATGTAVAKQVQQFCTLWKAADGVPQPWRDELGYESSSSRMPSQKTHWDKAIPELRRATPLHPWLQIEWAPSRGGEIHASDGGYSGIKSRTVDASDDASNPNRRTDRQASAEAEQDKRLDDEINKRTKRGRRGK